MRAISEDQIFSFEGNLEKSFKDYLQSVGLEVGDSNNPEVLPSNFIGIEVEIGSATGKAIHKPDGQPEYSQYAFTVSVTVSTDRDEDSTIDEIRKKHQQLVAGIRKHLAVSNAKGKIDDFLDFYEINTLMPTGSSREVNDSTDMDQTTLVYEGQFSILSTVWPL